MSKDKIGTEQNFDTVLERVNVDSKALLVKTPFDNLKIKKDLDQLYHTLKRRNEEEKTIPEELRARNIFRLSQLGIECSNIAQTLIHEQYFINKRKEDKANQSTNQFATNLGEDYDINNYIQKYTDFMLFNLTDHAYIQGKNRTQKNVASKLNALWSNDVKKLIDSKKVKGDNLIPGSMLFPQGVRNTIKRKSKGIDDKKANYLNSLNKYMRLKYLDKEDPAASVSSMISEFIAFTRNDPEVCEIWKILERQVSAYEDCVKANNPNENFLDGVNDNRKEVNYYSDCYSRLIQVNCQLLEEEFLNVITSSSSGSYVSSNVPGIKDEDSNFIIQEYLSSSFRRRNYIEFDEGKFPVWAYCYITFRSNRLQELQNYLERYEGSLKGEVSKLKHFLSEYRSQKGNLPVDSCQSMLQSLDLGEQDVDVFKKMLFCVLIKSQEVPSEDLLSRLGDYLWFNLKICSAYEEELNERGFKVSSNTRTLFEVQKEILKLDPEHFNPENTSPLNYVKTLFIIEAYDEALHFLRSFNEYSEELIHFAISLYESGLINIRWEYSQINKHEFNFFKDSDYCREVIEYATSFCEKNPLEAALYLRLLWSNKNGSDDGLRKRQIIETISNFIITHDQVVLFFDKTRDSQRNARYLEDIVGTEIYKGIVLEITKHYKKSNLTVALVLLDKINFNKEVLELILEEEYENLRKFKERSKGRDISVTKSPHESFFNDILDNYNKKNILNKFRFEYTAYEFVRKVRILWENIAKKNFNDAFELLRKWDHEWYIFGYNPEEILDEFTVNHQIVQRCYLDLLIISSRIIREYMNFIKVAPKSQEYIRMKLNEAHSLWNRSSYFYKKIKRKLAKDPKHLQTLKDLDNEFEIEINP